MTVLLGKTWRGWADAPPSVLGFVLRCALRFAVGLVWIRRLPHQRAGLRSFAFFDISLRPGDCL
jgi:hypothetical protein